MKRIIIFLSLIVFSTVKMFSQCSEPTETKVLLVGDSWAFFMGVDGTINNALKNYGHSGYKFLTNLTIAENGAKTDDFLRADKQEEIARLLNENPSIEVVHLSIGGNDVLGNWKSYYTQEQTDSLKLAVADSVIKVIDFIKSVKPGIKILYSGYCYPNFQEVVETSSPPFNGANHPFYGTWAGMEFPTFTQINTILNDFGDLLEAHTVIDQDVKFYNASGLMQYVFGQNTPLGVAPGGSYPPQSVSLPLGKVDYPSPQNSMRDYLGFTKDCFHLSAAGYLALVEYSTQKFYQKFFMDDLYLLAEEAQSGSVSMSGDTATTFYLGDTGSDIFSTVLSFNTTSMADTTLSKASIFLHKESSNGQNLINGNLTIKVKNGNFGTSVNVDAADLTDEGDASGNPCIFGTNENGKWVRLDLPNNVLPYIRKDAPTQFIITAENITGSSVTFSSTTDHELAPILNLAYGQTPTGIKESETPKNIYIYPNPTSGKLTIETGDLKIDKIQLTDITGKILQNTENSKVLDVSDIAVGMYFVTLYTESGVFTKRVIKE